MRDTHTNWNADLLGSWYMWRTLVGGSTSPLQIYHSEHAERDSTTEGAVLQFSPLSILGKQTYYTLNWGYSYLYNGC